MARVYTVTDVVLEDVSVNKQRDGDWVMSGVANYVDADGRTLFSKPFRKAIKNATLVANLDGVLVRVRDNLKADEGI